MILTLLTLPISDKKFSICCILLFVTSIQLKKDASALKINNGTNINPSFLGQLFTHCGFYFLFWFT